MIESRKPQNPRQSTRVARCRPLKFRSQDYKEVQLDCPGTMICGRHLLQGLPCEQKMSRLDVSNVESTGAKISREVSTTLPRGKRKAFSPAPKCWFFMKRGRMSTSRSSRAETVRKSLRDPITSSSSFIASLFRLSYRIVSGLALLVCRSLGFK